MRFLGIAARFQHTIAGVQHRSVWPGLIMTLITPISFSLQDLHKDVCERVDQQYSRLIEDLTSALTLEKDIALSAMSRTLRTSAAPIAVYLEASGTCSERLNNLVSDCEELGLERPLKETLTNAHQVEPLNARLKDTRQEYVLFFS